MAEKELGSIMTTKTLPKPLVKVSDKPIIVHIINHYLSYGFKNFYLALGYKSEKFHNFSVKINPYLIRMLI